jgi:hypothetical protein
VVFREVAMIEIREVLRCWLGGQGLRTAGQRAGVDRKTARRYVEAAVAAGLVRDGGEDQLTDELLGAVVAAVRPARAGSDPARRLTSRDCEVGWGEGADQRPWHGSPHPQDPAAGDHLSGPVCATLRWALRAS